MPTHDDEDEKTGSPRNSPRSGWQKYRKKTRKRAESQRDREPVKKFRILGRALDKLQAALPKCKIDRRLRGMG